MILEFVGALGKNSKRRPSNQDSSPLCYKKYDATSNNNAAIKQQLLSKWQSVHFDTKDQADWLWSGNTGTTSFYVLGCTA